MPTRKIGLKNPYLICDLCGGAHEANECDQNNPTEQVCLSGGYIYDEPSLLRFYQNGDIPPWRNKQKKGEGEGGPKWGVRNSLQPTATDYTGGTIERGGSESKEPNIFQNEEIPR
ncbi:hypothetical protein Tco_0168540 [Tanacetum coccineum]|uniref:Uncharacterized protein n=1 Tax=Tanacetum coccineum TaxID=301880 RepID=A0ABQ5EHB3_9ASTR